ncbi:hypothetical protein [Chryseobacterium caseinilyticum]|uniref:Uncharacterized protein n=1 Tax=Chryseobacterium caseinilyticum TaxID=2771428 RepID=A0ABR8ZC47_9FLAO|nr:hypothetical protein [Chryseobacterium caseinilyticum]MBD8082862.1 hypothetical protein [Chryseobacterium caseinilyticum]
MSENLGYGLRSLDVAFGHGLDDSINGECSGCRILKQADCYMRAEGFLRVLF